jgi:hypothetical protein
MGLKTVVYLEGGGSNEKKQRAPYRSEFAKLLEKAEITNVRVIACGSRNEAHNSFRNHVGDERAVLLVDSEDPVDTGHLPLAHLAVRDAEWQWPNWVTNDHVHLMATTIETWISCDPNALRAYFGPTFDKSKLVHTVPIETAGKKVAANTAGTARTLNMPLTSLHCLTRRS